MEFRILSLLDFNMTFPTIYRFIERYSRIAQASEKTFTLAQYFTDSALLDCTLMKEKPSKIAAISLYAALKISKGSSQSIWNATLTKNTGYKEDELRDLASDMIAFINSIESSSYQTFVKKYSHPKYLEVGKLLH